MWAFYPFEKLVFKNVLKIFLINIWIFIPLLIYMWGVEGVTDIIIDNIMYFHFMHNQGGKLSITSKIGHEMCWVLKLSSQFIPSVASSSLRFLAFLPKSG